MRRKSAVTFAVLCKKKGIPSGKPRRPEIFCFAAILHSEKPVRRLAGRTFRLERKQLSLVRERGIDRRRPVRAMDGEQVEGIFFEKHEWILLKNMGIRD